MTLEVLFVQDIDKLNERHYLKEENLDTYVHFINKITSISTCLSAQC